MASPLLPVSEALTRLLEPVRAVADNESVPLDEAAGRILAVDLVAKLTQPPFHASAMDGYALRAADAPDLGAELTVVGQAAAGHAFNGQVGPGECVRIFTGAPLPEGADSILIQEDAERLSESRIRTKFPVTVGRHIRPRGQDFAEGETVLRAGVRLDYAHLTVAAATNHPQVEVLRRPRVAVLATGDELVHPGSSLQPSQIIASNTFGISALIRANGGEVIDLGIIPDRQDLIENAIAKAVAEKVDVLVTLGGASVGDHDLVQASLKAQGMSLDFWRIAMRPGKPLMVGSLGDMRVLGLPGNPVASLVCGTLFLEPVVAKLSGTRPKARMAEALAGKPLAANDQRQDYLRARLSRDADGRLIAEPFDKQDSSMMKIFAHSDCLIVRPPHAPELAALTPCPILLLRDFDR
ncbi:molybdopterin molybdotransferase MoeA [Rhizobium rhizoryzae]|uniref:molybdopterin molybdotransferase MoeA n=1 Tax=Rhizobium rhizoryzae TaxID=451876 RepID=UPI00289A4DD7|nr:gephyrin-like molybdotransferase Glp [Rhizobium rhizoryzae]